MKPTAPLARALVKQTIELRDRALTAGVVTRATLGRVWPRHLSIGDFPLGQCVAVTRMLNSALSGSPFGILDERTRLLLQALDDEPVPVKGTEHRAFPKSYTGLALTEHVSFSAVRAGRTPVSERYAQLLRCWIATHAGPGLPFRKTSEPHTVPDWVAELPWPEVELAYGQANALRCEAISGERLQLADLTAGDYVPKVIRVLAAVTEIESETLMEAYTFSKCLAMAAVASDSNGQRV